MKKTDDYELYNTNFDEFVRLGQESFGLLPFEPTKKEQSEHDEAITEAIFDLLKRMDG